MATIVPRKTVNGTFYQAKVRRKGFPPQSKTFRRKTDALRWAAAAETHLYEARHFNAPVEQHKLADLVDRYKREILPNKPKDFSNQRRELDWWATKLGHLDLADVTPARIAACRDELLRTVTVRGRLRAPATVVRYLAVLSHAFTVATKEWEWTTDNPLRRVTKPKEPRGRVRFLDDDERERLLAACRESSTPFLYPIVMLAISTGMRRGELMGIRWADVDFERHVITLHETKNGERRVVPLTGPALSLMEGLHASRSRHTDLVFPRADLQTHVDITQAWRTAIAKAQLSDFRFHDLRHTAASYLAQGGATPLEIAEVLGHKTLAMVKRYAHTSLHRTSMTSLLK